ncbi:MAG: ABC transporter substrate-binding protein [Roseburia sp.]|nr:ABC transporter substrate-binding protein [Roseburia sp.]MCM1096796.1 ABC transporter substrate-binding protein [Ruminococcus flavefaciens]
MKKKLLALLLAAAMTLSLAACGGGTDDKESAGGTGGAGGGEPAGEFVAGDDPSEWPVISIMYPAPTTMAAEVDVEKALNEYLVSINAGVQADIVQIAIGDLATQLTLSLSDNTNPMDLFCWRFYSTVDGCVKNEQCISLDPYLEEYADMWEMFPEKVLMTQQIDGVQYAVPSVDSYGTYEVYMLRKDIAEEMGIADRDGEEITLEEMTQIMKDAKAIHPEYAYMINTNDDPVQGLDSLGNGNWLGVLLNRGVGTTDIVNYYETEEFRDFCYLMKEWNEAGLLCDDPLNNSMTIEQYNNDVAAGCYVGGYSADYIKALVSYTYDNVQFKLTDLVGTSASVLGGWMISSVCKHPDAAMKMLYLMTTDENVARYIILGVEGQTYTVDEKGIARYPEGIDSNTSTWNLTFPWYWPNQCLSLPLETDFTAYYTDMWDAPNHAQFSSAMGFVFDSANVYDQMAACATVVAEYRPALLYGLVDVDEYLAKFNQELKDAGIDEIIAEEQRQFDEFLKALEDK